MRVHFQGNMRVFSSEGTPLFQNLFQHLNSDNNECKFLMILWPEEGTLSDLSLSQFGSWIMQEWSLVGGMLINVYHHLYLVLNSKGGYYYV